VRKVWLKKGVGLRQQDRGVVALEKDMVGEGRGCKRRGWRSVCVYVSKRRAWLR